MAVNLTLEMSEGFAPRTRQVANQTLADLQPTLAQVAQYPGKVFTIAHTDKPQEAAALVSLLSRHLDDNWTFASRNVNGAGLAQAKYDPDNPRPKRAPRTPATPEQLAERKAKREAAQTANGNGQKGEKSRKTVKATA